MKRQPFKLILTVIYLLLSFNLKAQEIPPVTVNVATAGTLPLLITSAEKYLITNLTVTGNLNGTDIRYIREMAGSDVRGSITPGKLSILDLSGVNIVTGGSSYYNSYTTSLNSIGIYAFQNCAGLTSIVIPNNVTSIGDIAFKNCTGLTSVTIPNSVTYIGDGAFENCTGVTSIVIPNSVKSIKYATFRSCTGLTSIVIPNSVTSIGGDAFSGCTGLSSITIPSRVTSIGDHAFSSCTKLKEFIVSESNTTFSSVEGILFNKNSTELIAYPNAKSNICTIPNSVTSIWDYAFSGCTGLTSVTIPNSVTYIGDGAFSGCTGVTSIVIPNSVTSVGIGTFWNCIKLTSITISNSVTSIGNNAFSNCIGLTSITIPNSVTYIGEEAFSGCAGVTEIHCKTLTPPNAVYHTFFGINTTSCKLFIPKETYANYSIALIWRDFTNIIEEESTAISQIEASNIKVYTEQNAILVTGAELGNIISVYNESGALLQSTKVTDAIVRINITTNHTYLVKTTNKTFKLAL